MSTFYLTFHLEVCSPRRCKYSRMYRGRASAALSFTLQPRPALLMLSSSRCWLRSRSSVSSRVEGRGSAGGRSRGRWGSWGGSRDLLAESARPHQHRLCMVLHPPSDEPPALGTSHTWGKTGGVNKVCLLPENFIKSLSINVYLYAKIWMEKLDY